MIKKADANTNKIMLKPLKYLNKMWLYVKYPLIFSMDISKFKNSKKFKNLGLDGFPPNYIYFNRFNENSSIVDVGCGFEAELSVTMIKKFNLNAYTVDPTLKHASFLHEIEKKYQPNFHYFQYALSALNGETTFYEAENCESGSLLSTHKNIQTDLTREYKVKLIDLPTLFSTIGLDLIDFLKIDIEGAEYALFNETNLKSLQIVKQLFVEFHHVSVQGYSKKDSLKIVKLIEKEGFMSFSYDGLNYLFYRE